MIISPVSDSNPMPPSTTPQYFNGFEAATSNSKWIRASRGSHCPKCQSTSDCRWKIDGLVHCHSNRASKRAIEGAYISRGEDKSGFGLWAINKEIGSQNSFVRQMSSSDLNARAHQKAITDSSNFYNCKKPLEAHNYWYHQGARLDANHRDNLLGRGLTQLDIDHLRFRSVGNGDYSGFAIPVSDVDGLTRGAQKRNDSGDVRYIWMGDDISKYLYEYYPKEELPSQWVSAGDRNEDGIIQRNYSAITELWITEGLLKPYILWCKNKADNLMVAGFSGGNITWQSLARAIEKLPNLQNIVIMPDAGAAINQQVATKVITLGLTLISLASRRFDVKIGSWGQWVDKGRGDCDELLCIDDSVSRQSVEAFTGCSRKYLADDRLQDFVATLIEKNSTNLLDIDADKSADNLIAINQDDPNWVKKVAAQIDEPQIKAVLLAMNTGFGKTHSAEFFVKTLGLNIIYFSTSPINPPTEWLENTLRFPVKHQGYQPNRNGSKLPSGAPQLVRADDSKAEKVQKTLGALVPSNCPEYASRVQPQINTAETKSPCKDCPMFGKCGYNSTDMPQFTTDVVATAVAGRGVAIRAHHFSAERLDAFIKSTPELKDLVFVKLIDDVHPEVTTNEVGIDYVKKILKTINKLNDKDYAQIKRFGRSIERAIKQAGSSIYSVPVDPLMIDLESFEYQRLLELAANEAEEVKLLPYDGDDYESYYPDDNPGFFTKIPGSEIQVDGKLKFRYQPESIKRSVEYLDIKKAASANRGEAIHTAVSKGQIGRFFDLLVRYPDAVFRIDSKNLTITTPNIAVMETIKNMGNGGTVVKMDATIIDCAFRASWGFSRMETVQFVSSEIDNSNLKFVDMLDIGKLRKDSPIEVADQLSNHIVEMARKNPSYKIGVISSRDFLGVENLDRFKKNNIIFMTAFGDSVGSNVAQECTHLFILSSFGTNLGAMQADYEAIFSAKPNYIETDHTGAKRSVSTDLFTYYSQRRNLSQLKQAVGRVRHNRRATEQINVYICDIRNLYGDLLASFPGCGYDTTNIVDTHPTAKQQQALNFVRAQNYIWTTEGSTNSFVDYKSIATRHFQGGEDEKKTHALKAACVRLVEKKHTDRWGKLKLPEIPGFKYRNANTLDCWEAHLRSCHGRDVPYSEVIMVPLRKSCEHLLVVSVNRQAFTPEPNNQAQMDAARIAHEEARIHLAIAKDVCYQPPKEEIDDEYDDDSLVTDRDRYLANLFAPPIF